jgi:hypothetical protein
MTAKDLIDPAADTFVSTEPVDTGEPIYTLSGEPPRRTPVGLLSGDYDSEVALLTAIICAWSYSDDKVMARQLPYYGLPNWTVQMVSATNRAMLVVSAAFFVRSADGRTAVLAFRGTVPDDFINWLTDADTSLRSISPEMGRVHSGFYRNLKPIWGEVADVVMKAVNEGAGRSLENLIIAGHSLGGAMAVIAAAQFASGRYSAVRPILRGVYTYGQPAVGDGLFRECCENRFKLYRHVFNNDMVPRMPPKSVGTFVHFGKEFFSSEIRRPWEITDGTRATQAPGIIVAAGLAAADYVTDRIIPPAEEHSKFLKFFLEIARVATDEATRYSLEDHGPENYIGVAQSSAPR